MNWDNVPTLVAAIIGVGSTGAVIYLAIVGQPVPEALVAISSAAIGFYLGRGADAAMRALLRR